jgi:anti-sigma B factor antagonist
MSGEFDMQNRDELAAVLSRANGSVILDMSDVTFFDSSAIGIVVAARNRLASVGGTLTVRNPQEPIRRVLEITGLADFIERG